MTTLITVLAAAAIGAFGIVGVIILAVLLHPEKVQIWVSWIFRGARLVIKKAEYGAVAYDVGGHISEFYNRDVAALMNGLPRTQVKLEWTNNAEAAASLREGTLIVRMRPHDERVANILHASMAAMPMLVAPTVRHDLRVEQSKAIDLELCRQLAKKLGAPGSVTYRAELLEPLLQGTPAIARLVEMFHTLELGGLFVPVFLQELIAIGRAAPTHKAAGLDIEVDDFADFLRNIAERERGEDVDLSFIGNTIKTNVLLVAHADRKGAGAGPFFRRIGIELGKGVESVYLMATEANFEFLNEIAAALDADMRLIKRGEHTLNILRGDRETLAKIVPFDRSPSYSASGLFEAAASDRGIAPGARFSAVVTDSQPSYALVDIDGMQGIIQRTEANWGFVEDVSEILGLGEVIAVEVIGIDVRRKEVRLSRKRCLESPLAKGPLKGIRGTMHPSGPITYLANRQVLIGTFEANEESYPAVLPQDEIEWGAEVAQLDQLYGDLPFDAIVIDEWDNNGMVVVSRKRSVTNQWIDIRDRYKRGMSLRSPVTAVAREGVYCEIEPGLAGFIPEDEFRLAGFELTDFLHNVKPGQVLHVYVRNVVGGNRQRLTLGLQRNRRD